MTDSESYDWKTERTYTVLRKSIRLVSTAPELGPILDRICADFEPSTEPPDATISMRPRDDGFVIHDGKKDRSDVQDFEKSAMKLMSVLHRVTMNLCELWSVHAGVVSRDGAAIAFPGKSGVGKSTLTGACVQAGFDYISDESLSFDPDTMLIDLYPKPIWMDWRATTSVGIEDESPAVTPDHYKYPVTPMDLGGTIADGPIALKTVILINRVEDGPASLEPLRSAELVTLLLRNTYKRARYPARNFAGAVEVASHLSGYRLTYVNPTAGAEKLLTGV